jgi:uncharacterized protein YukE
MGAMKVTPEVLRDTKAAMENAMEHAQAIVQQYLTTHQDVMGVVWNGPAGTSSNTTAGILADDLNKTTQGCLRMAHGLGNAASLVEQHEIDQARALASFDVGQSV